MKSDLTPIIDLLQSTASNDLLVYDEAFLKKTIDSGIAFSACKTPQEYLLYLSNHPLSVDALHKKLNNSYSEFFRNPLTFACIEQIVFPSLTEKVRQGIKKEIRIWSAACAEGQEAYSIAMLCDEAVKKCDYNIIFRVFGTDINKACLALARKACYPIEPLGKISVKRVKAYFTHRGDNYYVSPKLKEYVDYSEFDLLSERMICPVSSVYGDFDLIFVSNILFYYKPEFQQRILSKVANCIAGGGYIITGEVERDILKENGFREVFQHSGIFQK